MVVDFKIDGEDQTLLLKSSDGKVFSISKERAMQSEVWKGMLELGTDKTQDERADEREAIQLEETSQALQIFLNSLVISKWTRIEIKPDGLVELLRLGDKYQSSNTAFFIPSMAKISKGQWTFHQIVQITHYSTLLNLDFLKDMALRQFITLGPLEDWIVEDATKQVNPIGLVDLIDKKQKWCHRWTNPIHMNSCSKPSNQSQCRVAWNRRVERSVVGFGLSDPYSQYRDEELCSLHAIQLLCHHNEMMRELLSLSI